MKDKFFIDTNIFVYAFLNSKKEYLKHTAAQNLLKNFDDKNSVIISTQVCSEYYSALLKNKINDTVIQESLKKIIDNCSVKPIKKSTIITLFNIKKRYKYSYWDSLILASTIENNCTILYSEDMQHNQIIENKLKIINPFINT